jgi:hypothetical protein
MSLNKAMKANTLRQSLAASAACACLIVPAVAVAQAKAQDPQGNTMTGTVTSVVGPGVIYEVQGGTDTVCEFWQITLASDSGQATIFHIESPTSGSIATGFTPTDPTALQMVSTLKQGEADGKKAVVTVSYVASETDCNEIVTNVLTSASLASTQEGRVTKLSSPSIVKRDGASCEIWQGTLKTKSGQVFTFAVESGLTNGHPKPQAVKAAKTLKNARIEGKHAVADISYTGPSVACGKTLPHVVTKASMKRSGSVGEVDG